MTFLYQAGRMSSDGPVVYVPIIQPAAVSLIFVGRTCAGPEIRTYGRPITPLFVITSCNRFITTPLLTVSPSPG
jgi:hypothetical protein